MALRSLLYRAAHAANTNPKLSKVGRRVVPPALMDLMGRAVAADKPQMIDLSRVDLIQGRGSVWLSDPANLEHDLLPALGFPGDLPAVFPDALQPLLGRGLRVWQHPIQFAPYLAHLAGYPVHSYLEIGVRHGGTFVTTVEYLSRFTDVREAVAVDIERVPAVEEYARHRAGVRSLQVDSTTPEFARYVGARPPFDLVLVDGDHSYTACRSDVDTIRNHANMIALHDIVDDAIGVARVWSELQAQHAADYEFFEYVAQYESVVERIGRPVLGLGLAVRKQFLSAASRGPVH
jgi:hypothetical protein